MIHILLGLILLFMIFTPGMPPLADTMQQEPSADSMDEAVKAEVLEAYGNLPVLFIQNDGQLDSTVEYYVKASRQTLYFTGDSIVFDLIRYQGTEETDLTDRKAERLVFSIDFLGARERPLIEAGDKDKATVNYFIGNDPEKWHTDIPTYKQLVYGEIYPGIDLRLYGKGGVLEYEFVVRPGARVADIALACTGVEGLAIAGGELVVGTAFGDMRQTAPYIYQRIGDDEVAVDGGFRLVGGSTYGFEAAAYDAGYPLIIDPSLVYSTYLGGNGWDEGSGIAVDGQGCAYITGYTGSDNTTFPLKDAIDGTCDSGTDAFVTKINAQGDDLVYSTYLGGTGSDSGYGIAVDASGCAYVTGYTGSDNTTFPLKDAIDGTYGGNYDAFVTKINALGDDLVYSTYLGGNDWDRGYGIAVDASGCAYITGYTLSDNFPLKNAYQDTHGGSPDAFVTKINKGGTAWVYSTYLGGNGWDRGYGIAVDGQDYAYVTGETNSATDFPLKDAYQGPHQGGKDAFVTSFTADGSDLVYSTYLGGTGWDEGYGIAVDASGCAYITGYTWSDNFPLKNAYQDTHGGGGTDAFVTKINAQGDDLVYSTYLGGKGSDSGHGIAVDGQGCAYVTGETGSDLNFPLKNASQDTYGGGLRDAFVTSFTADGSELMYSTYLGGSSKDMGHGITVDGQGRAYITGHTDSTNFPLKNAIDGTCDSGTDAFVTKLGGPDITATPASMDFGPVVVTSSSAPQTVTVSNIGTDNLTIGTIDIIGADASQFSKQNDNVSGQTISPGGSATLEVVFNPTSVGTKTAALSIPSNDQDNATVNVALSGTGIQQTQAAAAPAAPRASHGAYKTPSYLKTKYLNVNPQQVYAGQTVTISTNVVNHGGEAGSYTVALKINGQVEQTRTVTVSPGVAQPVRFTVSKTRPGTYTVAVGGDRGQFTVIAASNGWGIAMGNGPVVAVATLVFVMLLGLLVVAARRRFQPH